MATIRKRFEAYNQTIDGNGNVTSCEVPYIVFFGANENASEAVALELVREEAKEPIGQAQLASVSVQERLNEKTYTVSAQYSQYADADENDAQVSFECGAQAMHIINALEQTRANGSPDVGLLINCDEHGNDPQGVDIQTAELRESYTKKMKITSSGNNYFKRKVAECVGKVNSRPFKNWEAGEVLFLGCSYSGKRGDRVQVTFNFAIRPNQQNVVVGKDRNGNNVTLNNKRGWQYVWTLIGNQSNAPKVFIRGAYLATVYETANFNSLGI